MGSKADMPVRMHPLLNNIFNKHFPILKTPKTDTREEDKQEGRQKPKKRMDDE